MSVIEMIMLLYTKEVVTPGRVLGAVQRFSQGENPVPLVPENHEQSMLLWVGHACEALKKRIEQETDRVSNGGDVSIKDNLFLYWKSIRAIL